MTRTTRPPAGACLGLILATLMLSGTALAQCPPPGEWRSGTGAALPVDGLFRDLAEARIVLLGERHDRMEHHRWQLHTLAGLHARHPNLAIGLEMLPREAQPALDAWVAGDLDEAAFLAQSEWNRNWGFEPNLYMPILHFARMHKVPLRAINLERSLVGRITGEGWDAVPAAERHGVSPPAPATDAYRSYLDAVLKEHPTGAEDGGDLDRFVAGQLVWDRAMAAGLADAAAEYGLVVGLMGSGHLEYGHGVPHQLADLGIRPEDQRVVLPWESGDDCRVPDPGIADTVFGIATGTVYEPRRPQLLGVRIDADPAGVRILFVQPDSVADASGLQPDDILTSAAGRDLQLPGDLVTVVRRQAPGTILPLTVLRNGEESEILARFPVRVD